MKSVMKSLFLLVLAGAALGEVQRRVYVGPNVQNKGGAASNNEGQHHVILESHGCAGEVVCGGSLIHQDWVITAAHCNCWDLKVFVNAHPNPANKEERGIDDRQFLCDNNGCHDLMLLKLKKGNRDNLPTIHLPPENCNAPPANTEVRFYGWTDAWLNPKVPQPGRWQTMMPLTATRLRFGDSEVVECEAGGLNTCPPFNSKFIPHHCVCVWRRDVSTNPGDSGGSLVWNKMLYGLLKGNFPNLNQGSQVFMDICYPLYRDWIKQNTGL